MSVLPQKRERCTAGTSLLMADRGEVVRSSEAGVHGGLQGGQGRPGQGLLVTPESSDEALQLAALLPGALTLQ